MPDNPQSYIERAEHCEQMALRIRDVEARMRFVEMARKWRALAKEIENVSRETGGDAPW